jgi:hypothetical protein
MCCFTGVQNSTIEKFIGELLHPDHNNPVEHIVVLDPDAPSVYVYLLLWLLLLLLLVQLLWLLLVL